MTKILFLFCCIILLFYCIIAICAPILAPYDPYAILDSPLQHPDSVHPLGTNATGQDILSQLIYGTRITLLIGFLAAIISCCISTTLGIQTGYYGGFFDELVMRVIDIFMTIPLFPLLLVLTLFFTPGIYTTAALMGIVGSTHSIRVVRSQVMMIHNATYIEGARSIGAKDHQIMVWHILPNILPLVSVKLVSSMQHYLLMGVGLSFLGLGDPMVIDWGQMIEQAYSSGGFALGLWWWLLPPGLAVVGISLSLALLGYISEEQFNHRLKVNRL
ncbi:ABC transporter permease [uncultured Methanospirillum sp.]|uniref:ABC transporter permease n=1 Tax=uncultured Methanospirillum sp. TaxID=262503 RepID=UPI0029C6592C|nr:ABC transporter permease [uncultured Methanospirillum sp.]